MPSSACKTSADRKSTRLNSSHTIISYAVFCLKKKHAAPNRRTRMSTERQEENIVVAWASGSPHAGGRAPWAACTFSAYALSFFLFFVNDPGPPEIYPLPLPTALPI